MTRRLFGPVSGPIAYLLVAALVFAGLGWVTYSALGVERSQREATARAEIGNNLRVALRDLDLRMLGALAVEDSRPYYHYAPPDPAATPLFVANLPDWMKLHFHLEPAAGWSSPYVCPPAVADQVREAWAEVSPHNMSPERAQVLNELKTRYPARVTCDQFAATERAIPSDSLSLAAPLVSGDVQGELNPPAVPQLTSPQFNPASNALPDPISNFAPNTPSIPPKADVVRLFGIELCLGPDGTANLARQGAQTLAQNNQQRYSVQAVDNPRGMSQATGGGRGGGRLQQKDSLDNEKQVLDWMNRAGLMHRAIREAKNAAEFQMPKGQLGGYGNNYLPGIDLKNSANTFNPAPGNSYRWASTSRPTLPRRGPGRRWVWWDDRPRPARGAAPGTRRLAAG